MILTEREKKAISQMKPDDTLIFDDENRSNYQYEVEKPSKYEYRVFKNAIMCLAVEYFRTPEEVINFIEGLN